jgi:hypothetical protein
MNRIFISAPDIQDKTMQIVIRSVTGNVVFEETWKGVSESSKEVDISKLVPGFFLVEIIAEQTRFQLSFVKEK